MKHIQKYWIYLCLVLIVGVGAWLRISGILSDSFAYTYDVGRDLLEVRKIVVDHDFILIGPTTGLAGLFYGPWWYYFLTIPFVIFQGNPQGVAFFIALTGIASVIIAFFLGKKLHSEFLGLFLAGLVSFSPYSIGLTSQIWNPNVAPFLVILTLYLLLVIAQEKKLLPMPMLGLGLLCGFMLDAEIVFGIVFSIGVLLCLAFQLKRSIVNRNLLFFAVAFLFTLSPRILFELRHDFLMTSHLFSTSGTEAGAKFSFPTFQILRERLVFFFDIFDRTFFDNLRLASGVLLICLPILYFIRRKAFSEREKIIINFISIITLIFILALSFFSHFIFDHYTVGLPMVFLVLTGVILYRGVTGNNILKIHLFGLASFLLIILQPMTFIQSLSAPTWEGDAAVYRNQLAVIDYIYEKARGEQFNYIAYTPAVHDYTYQYLFLWYGKNKYNYIPDKEKQTLFFAILEPDYQHPERLRDWLVVREGDGKIVAEKVVKGGIRVQTRVH